MTTTVLTRGSDWGIFANHGVYANWGDCDGDVNYDATYKKLGDMVVSRFHELCRNQEINASWIPYTSEVIGDIDQTFDDGLLDELREQASAEIWEKWTNGDIDPVMNDAE